MKIALCGATGKAGSRIMNELLTRGHQVLAIVRALGASLPEAVKEAVDDLSDAKHTAATIKGVDAFISAYAPPLNDPDELVHVTKRLVDATEQSGVPRFLMVGADRFREATTRMVVDRDSTFQGARSFAGFTSELDEPVSRCLFWSGRTHRPFSAGNE